MEYGTDKSGINSLAGFAYQIKVFAYYAFDLKDNMSIEFETIDDVNVKKILPSQIDENSHKFTCTSNNNGSNNVIQVKHTSVSNAVAQQMLLNWILLEQSENKVDRYTLFSAKSYNNSGTIFPSDIDKLYKEIIKSDKKANAIISKVKKMYENDFEAFKKVYSSVKNKFDFIDLDNINKSGNVNKCAVKIYPKFSETTLILQPA